MGFDFEEFRLPPSFNEGPVAKKLPTVMKCRKPGKLEFFRIRPGPEWEFLTYLLDMKELNEEKYLVCPGLIPELQKTGVLRPVMLYMGIIWNMKEIFLTDVPIPDADGSDNLYNKSRRGAYEKATEKWIKITANRELGAYDVWEAEKIDLEPEWPESPATMSETVKIAFKDRVIDNLDHPVMKRIRGEI